jgi:hypothetical protein
VTAELALAGDAGFLERSADPGEFIIQACERAKTWLREALENGQIDQIVELRSQAEAVRIYTMQKQLGKDAQLSALEIVRRAERGIGIAIRRGQAEGTIRGRHQGKRIYQPGNTGSLIRSPTEFASSHELTGGGGPGDVRQPGIYDLTDGVSDDDFEQAIAEARAEENLSRASMARKVGARKAAARQPDGDWVPDPNDKSTTAAVQRRNLIRKHADGGYSSRQIAEAIGISAHHVREIARNLDITISADAFISRTRHIDSSRIVRETTHSLEGLAMGIELADIGDLDPAEAKDWAASMSASIRVLSRFARQLKEI